MAFKICQNPFPAWDLPRTTLGAHYIRSLRRPSWLGTGYPSHIPPHSAPTHLWRSPCVPPRIPARSMPAWTILTCPIAMRPESTKKCNEIDIKTLPEPVRLTEGRTPYWRFAANVSAMSRSTPSWSWWRWRRVTRYWSKVWNLAVQEKSLCSASCRLELRSASVRS